MEEFFQKALKFSKEDKLNDLLSLFKSKTKQVSNEDIEIIYQYSISKELPALTLLILKLRIKTIKKLSMSSWDAWISATSNFLINSPPMLKKKYYKLSYYFSELCCEIGLNYNQYLKTAQYTLLKILESQGRTNEITPIHPCVCKIGLITKKLYDLHPLLDYDYLSVDKDTGVTGVHCVTFFYYLGSIALILKNYHRAAYFYELAITIPSKAVHQASIESFKKQVLVQLITDGTEYHVPRTAPNRFSAIVRTHACEVYTKLALLFTEYLKGKGLKDNVIAHITKNKSAWVSDGNSKLIQTVRNSLIKHKIKKLTKVYASLTFTQLIEQVEESDAQEILVSMVESQEINGKIDMRNNTVMFYDTENTVEVEEIQDICESLLKYSEYVENRTRDISFDTRYLKQLIMQENLGKDR